MDATESAIAGGTRIEIDPARPPLNKLHLWRWVQDYVWVSVPEGAPLDYLAHAFFEGEDTWPGPSHARAQHTIENHRPSSQPSARPEAPRTDCVVWACRGGGKTFLAALATALDLYFKPGIDVRLLAGSLEQGQRMHEHLKRILARPPFADEVRRSTATTLELHNGSRAVLLAQSHASVRGTRVQKLRCDEVELFDPDVWKAAQLTTQSKDCGGVPVRGAVEALSTMHRPYGTMSALVEEARAGQRRLFRWGITDVLAACGTERRCEAPCALLKECAGRAKEFDKPQAVRRRGFVPIQDAITMKSRVDQTTWDSEMLCLKVSRSDRVLPEFDRDLHVFDSDVADGKLIAGIDFGFRAPTVVLWAVVDREGTVRVVAERVESGLTISEHIAAIKASPWANMDWIGVDPSGLNPTVHGEGAVRALRDAGFNVRLRHLRVTPGLTLLRARLRAADGSPPGLLVHARCTRLIEALTKYHYNPADLESEEPVKDGSDHAVDALRYLIVNLDRPEETKFGRYAA